MVICYLFSSAKWCILSFFFSQHGSDGLVTRLDYELTEWRYDFPNALKRIELPDFHEDVGHFAPVIASLLMFYCSSLVLLYQPFIKKTISRSSYTSQQICSSAATRGMRIACRLTARDFLMCPYSFTVYPIMQFGLIHMYNGKNVNPQISSPAKAYLKRGVKFLENIKYMSATAARLHRTFKNITQIASLQINNDDDLERALAREECHLEENIHRVFEKHGKDKHKRRNMSSIMDAVMLRPSTYHPKNDLNNKQQPAATDAMSANGSSINSPHSTSQRTSVAAAAVAGMEQETTPILFDMSNASFQPSLNMEAEAFSLTQFGYNTTNDTSSLDYILQNINTLSAGINNDLFASAPSAPPLQQQEQHRAYSSPIVPFHIDNYATVNATTSQQQPLPQQEQQMDTNDIFRSDPNNVFWELPSSMEGLNQWLDTMNATGWKAFDQQ